MKTCLSTWVLGLVLAITSVSGTRAQEVPLPASAFPPAPAPAAHTPKTYTSFWLSEILKLAQAGIAEEVLFSYIDNSPGTFNLAADHIIALRNFGVSGDVINAMIRHDAEIASGHRKLPASTIPSTEPLLPIAVSPASTTNAPATAPVVAASPAPMAAPEDSSPEDLAQPWEPRPAAAVEPAAEDSSTQHQHVRNLDRKPVYRVREPYPVPLTEPIIVYRAEVRPPNLQLLQLFPRQ